MARALSHIRTYIFRGILAAVPFGLAYLAIRLVYVSIDQQVVDLLAETVGLRFPGMGLLLALVTLYALGVVTSNVVGRRLLNAVDRVTTRIPLVKTAYQIGKQLSEAFSLPGKQAFKRAVLVRAQSGAWLIGLVTGEVTDRATGESLLKVFVPLPPNPTAGLILIVRESETRDPGWSVEEALKCAMSVGIIGPPAIGLPAEGAPPSTPGNTAL